MRAEKRKRLGAEAHNGPTAADRMAAMRKRVAERHARHEDAYQRQANAPIDGPGQRITLASGDGVAVHDVERTPRLFLSSAEAEAPRLPNESLAEVSQDHNSSCSSHS